MAILKKGILGTPKGRIGTVIGYQRNNKGILQCISNPSSGRVNSVLSRNASDLSTLATQINIVKGQISLILDKIGIPNLYDWNQVLAGFHTYNPKEGNVMIANWLIPVNQIRDSSSMLYETPPPPPFLAITLLDARKMLAQYPNLEGHIFRNRSDTTSVGESSAPPHADVQYTVLFSITPPPGVNVVGALVMEDTSTGKIGNVYMVARLG